MIYEKVCGKKDIGNGKIEVHLRKWNDGACSCYSDCDCYKNKGWKGPVTIKIIKKLNK